MSPFKVIGWVAFAFYVLIYLPFVIYSFVILWKHKNNPLMQKRYPLLSYITVIFLFLMAGQTAFINQESPSLTMCILQTFCKNSSVATEGIVQAIFLIPLITVFTLRVYVLYFDLKWNEGIANSEWWKHINSNEGNWFIRSKTGQTNNCLSHWLRFRYLYIGVVLYLLLFIILNGLVVSDHGAVKLEIIFIRIPIIISFISTAIFLYLMPHFDTIRIRFELIIIIIIWDFTCIYFGLTGGMQLAKKSYIVSITSIIMNYLVGISITYISILYPIGHLITKNKFETELVQNQNDQNERNWKTYICASVDNFNHFMRFLVKVKFDLI